MRQCARMMLPLLVLAGLGLGGAGTSARAEKIHTGAPTGVYHSVLCPLLQKQLEKSQLPYVCTTSTGSGETLSRIASEPRHIGYVQFDVLTLEAERSGLKDRFLMARSDDTRECLFLATRNQQFTSLGDVQAYAHELRFVLPPASSGSATTFAFLQKIDPEGLGRAKSVAFADSTDDAVRQAMSAEDILTLFVQVPDPKSAIFRTVNESGGQMIPVIDRTILRQQVGGQKVYFAEETEVTQAAWVKSGRKVVTACTPVVVMTGNPERIQDAKARQEHIDVIATIQRLRTDDLLPKQTVLDRILKRSRELSALSVEKMMDVSEKARVAAKPALEKAKEATEKAYERAKDATRDALERARETIELERERLRGEQPATPPAAPQPPKG